MIESIGRRAVAAVAAVEAVGRFGHFLADLARAVPDVATWGRLTPVQMRRIGVDSLPVALFIAAFTGVVLALQASYTFTGAVPLYFVGTLVAADSVMVRIANRSGTLGLLVADSALYRETTLTMIQLRQLLSDIQANPRTYFTFSVF